MSDQEPGTLKSVFSRAEQTRESLAARADTTSDPYRDALAAAIDDYQDALQLISRLALFSPNESSDDIATPDLPYLLANYRLAELVQKIPSIPSPSPQSQAAARRRVLARSRDALERFLHLLDGYSFLSPAHARLLERYGDDPARFSVAATSAGPHASRDAKLESFRAERELRQRLELLRRRRDCGGPDGADEEAARALHLANLEFCAHGAFQALEALNRELDVLAMAPADPIEYREDDRRESGRPADGFSERLDGAPRPGGGPLLTRDGKPLQPFTIVGGRRQELRDGVFRPGHNLPTMSIDEYLEEERRRGGIIEGGGEASLRAGAAEPDEDDVKRADAETMKAREWDEFKEANPRGAGNTLNRG